MLQMLATLRIKNLALVSDLTVELAPGYNAITGETGAGKSIIIGALKLVLGERADRTLMRAGADSCSVEAVFSLKGELLKQLNHLLEENGLEQCEEGQLVLKRSFTSSGTNKQFVNGSPATLSVLSELGEWLVDLHGPHEHQSLLHPRNQLRILDSFGGLEDLREKVATLYGERGRLLDQKKELIVDERTYAQQLDLLRFQVKEITGAKLLPEEEDQLESDYQRASNAARLQELGQAAIQLLNSEDSSLSAQAAMLGRTLQDLARIDGGAMRFVTSYQGLMESIGDLQRDLEAYVERVELDPARLQELERRVDLIQSLKRKYGSSIGEVIEFGNEAARRLHALETREMELEKINAEIASTSRKLVAAAKELSVARSKTVPRLAKAVSPQLEDLGFRQSQFSISVESAESKDVEGISSSGADVVEFLFAPNPGEPARPLRAIASSGELARVMLALKTVLAAQDRVPVLIFDEVDANVGGETASVVGEKMRQIGSRRQVLCISHLPPVAAAAEAHYVVTKDVQGGRSISAMHKLEGKERVSELARMLGGQSEAARKHAEALLSERK